MSELIFSSEIRILLLQQALGCRHEFKKSKTESHEAPGWHLSTAQSRFPQENTGLLDSIQICVAPAPGVVFHHPGENRKCFDGGGWGLTFVVRVHTIKLSLEGRHKMSMSAIDVAKAAIKTYKLEDGEHAIMEVTGDGARIVMSGNDPYTMLPEYAMMRHEFPAPGLQGIGLLMTGWGLSPEDAATREYEHIWEHPNAVYIRIAQVMLASGNSGVVGYFNDTYDASDGAEAGGPIHDLFSAIARFTLRVAR